MQLKTVGKNRIWLSIDNTRVHLVHELRLKKNQSWFAQMVCSVHDDEIRLHWIQVVSTSQNKGYGKFLIHQLFKYKKKITGCTHIGALKFFCKMGFRVSPIADSELYDIEWSPDWVKLS